MLWAIGALLIGVSLGATYVALRVAARSDRKHERREQAWSAERRELLNRIMYLSNRPWESPPIEDREIDTSNYADFEPPVDPMLAPLPGEYDGYYPADPEGGE